REAARPSGTTTAMEYEGRDGTARCERRLRTSIITTTSLRLAIKGTKISRKFDGRWVKTIVFKSPIRRAMAGAARKESAARKLVPKKIPPNAFRSVSYRR